MAKNFQDVQTHRPHHLPPKPTSHHDIAPPFHSSCSVCSATSESVLLLITFSSDEFSALEGWEVHRTAPPPTPLPFLVCDAEVDEIWLQALDMLRAAEVRPWRSADSDVPMSATVGSTCEGIQKVLP